MKWVDLSFCILRLKKALNVHTDINKNIFMVQLFLILSSRKEVSTTAQRFVITQYMIKIYEAHKIAQSKKLT